MPTLEAVYGSIHTLDVPTSMNTPPRPWNCTNPA
jgi:hypothetical protein